MCGVYSDVTFQTENHQTAVSSSSLVGFPCMGLCGLILLYSGACRSDIVIMYSNRNVPGSMLTANWAPE